MNKIKDFPVYNENPIKPEGLKVVKYLTKEDEGLITDHNTGDMFKISKLPKEKSFLKDSFKYIKIFKDSIKEITNLSSKGIKLWGYIMYNLDSQTDTIIIYPEDCKDFCEYKTVKNVYPAIIELLTKNFIFRKEESTIEYYINLNIMYNGKRKIS